MPEQPSDEANGPQPILRETLDRLALAGWLTSYAETEYGFAVKWTDEGEKKLVFLWLVMTDLVMEAFEPDAWWALGLLCDMKFAEESSGDS